jgi:hypothetical protein
MIVLAMASSSLVVSEMKICIATNVAPTQKDQPLPSSKRKPHFYTH